MYDSLGYIKTLYTVRTIESFIDTTNILKKVLPDIKPTSDMYIKVQDTDEIYKWNYNTRTFDLVPDTNMYRTIGGYY